ncbi:MAG: sensor histidine kinase [Blautia marasmi]
MNFADYLKDKTLTILLHILCMIGSFIYLYTCGLRKNQLLLFYIFWLFLLAAYFIVDWYRKNRYFRELFHILDSLDKPYLISEIMPDSFRLEDRLYKRILRSSNKAVIDAVHHLESERTEYKDFIENWIHEVKLPITSMNLICDNNKTAETRKIKAQLTELENDVEKALFYARSDTVYQDYLIHKITLKDTVLTAIQRIRPYLIKNNVQVDLQGCEETVYCDDKWLEFILNQIFLNAVKYKRGGLPHLHPYRQGKQPDYAVPGRQRYWHTGQ